MFSYFYCFVVELWHKISIKINYHFPLWDYHVVSNRMGARDFKFLNEKCSILSLLKGFELRPISNNGLKT